MAGWFITAIVLGIISLVILGVGIFAQRTNRGGAPTFIAAGVVLALAIAAFTTSCFTMVGTKQIGVVTTFGRPDRPVDNGLHRKLPWQKVIEVDGTIQTDIYADPQQGDDSRGNAMVVRIANQATAYADVSIQWRTVQADDLLGTYKTLDAARAALVSRNLRTSLNGSMSAYDAFQTVETVDKDGHVTPAKAKSLTEISNETTNSLRLMVNGKDVEATRKAQFIDPQAPAVGKRSGQIEIISVQVAFIAFDTGTQSKLNQLQGAVADTRIAKQKQQTALAEADANNKLSASVANNSGVLVSKCMDIQADAVKAHVDGPDYCWPFTGGTILGGSSSQNAK